MRGDEEERAPPDVFRLADPAERDPVSFAAPSTRSTISAVNRERNVPGHMALTRLAGGAEMTSHAG